MNSRSIVSFFRVASLLMLLVVVGLLAAITTMHFAIHGAEVQVPALKGMTVADAHSEIAGLGLKLDVDNRYYSADVAPGHILTQSPPPGTVVRQEWKVRVSESLGPQMVDVPDTVGRDQRVAELELRRAGLDVRATAMLPYANAPAGTVLAQDPPAHAQDIAQPSVSLLVAAADEEGADGYVMPDLVGLPVVTAQSALAKVGIKSATPQYIDIPIGSVGTGNAPPVQPVRPGSVTMQTPPAGARVELDSIVHLTVAK